MHIAIRWAAAAAFSIGATAAMAQPLMDRPLSELAEMVKSRQMVTPPRRW
ncbi:MAG: hypothetical protein AcusKO_34270 [Acuticoccus sp.]